MSQTIMYTLSTCGICEKVRDLLTARGVAFEERVLDDNTTWQDEVIRLTAQYTVPVLIHPDGRVEVGFEGETG